MNPAELLREKREEIKSICAKHGASSVRVFGSVARGDFGEKSDIDILLKLDSSKLTGMRYFGVLEELREELEALLQCKVDVVDELGLKDPLPDYVLKEAVSL